MKRLVLVLLVVLPALGYGQTYESKSRVRLHDGSELNVTIVENVIGDYIRIKLPGGQITKIDYNQIESIKHQGFKYHSKFILPKGFYLDGAFNLLFGKTSSYGGSRIGFALGLTANYRINSFFSAGLGVEPTMIQVNGENLFLPVYLHISGNFVEKRVAPVYFVDGGWALPLAGGEEVINSEGGWFIRPGVGIQIDNIYLKIGYQVQKVTTTTEQNWWWSNTDRIITVEERILRNVTLGVSYVF